MVFIKSRVTLFNPPNQHNRCVLLKWCVGIIFTVRSVILQKLSALSSSLARAISAEDEEAEVDQFPVDGVSFTFVIETVARLQIIWCQTISSSWNLYAKQKQTNLIEWTGYSDYSTENGCLVPILCALSMHFKAWALN